MGLRQGCWASLPGPPYSGGQKARIAPPAGRGDTATLCKPFPPEPRRLLLVQLGLAPTPLRGALGSPSEGLRPHTTPVGVLRRSRRNTTPISTIRPSCPTGRTIFRHSPSRRRRRRPHGSLLHPGRAVCLPGLAGGGYECIGGGSECGKPFGWPRKPGQRSQSCCQGHARQMETTDRSRTASRAADPSTNRRRPANFQCRASGASRPATTAPPNPSPPRALAANRTARGQRSQTEAACGPPRERAAAPRGQRGIPSPSSAQKTPAPTTAAGHAATQPEQTRSRPTRTLSSWKTWQSGWCSTESCMATRRAFLTAGCIGAPTQRLPAARATRTPSRGLVQAR